MMKETLKEPLYAEEIVQIVKISKTREELRNSLKNYHDNDIAQSLGQLNKAERLHLFHAIGAGWASEIVSYIDNPSMYLEEIGVQNVVEVINEMDADDAVDLLESLSADLKGKIRDKLNKDVSEDIKLLSSYEDDEIGSFMTTNYICINNKLSVRQAMHELIRQAGDNDNISTIYVVNGKGSFCGAIELKDLIRAREKDDIDDIISYSYPYLLANEKIADSIEKIKDYSEDSLPVLNEKKEIVGILTAQDVIEMVDDEMSDDYAKLAGLSAEEDLNETPSQSMKKRLPWLIILLALGMGVSSVVGVFEGVVAVLPIIICFQSLILDMAGNVGTQSLAVTIRVLMDEEITTKDKIHLVIKELRVGMKNGFVLGIMALICLGIYIYLFKGYSAGNAFLISACVGTALFLAIIISSLVGTLIPMAFHMVNVDPAVASGPLITTVNDLVAVMTYYGLAWGVLIQIMHVQ